MAFYITRVRAKAFKNIGSEFREVSFAQGLNAVVGPNGCGKSNLLEAVLFAFAAPATSFGVGQLAELQNSESSEVCEVHVELSTRRSFTRHTVSAVLAPDGTRALKVNGKSRSGKEVKEFLRGLGISVDASGAVIKQAQVTRLADLNNPAELAAVVADASGLGRWSQERRVAAEELARTRQAIASVQEKLKTLELALAEDARAVGALQRLEALDAEIAGAEWEGAAQLARGLAHCGAQLGRLAEEAARLQGELAAGEERAQALEAQTEQLAEEAAGLEGAGGSPSGAHCQRAALMEEVEIVQQRLEECAQQRAALQARRRAAQQTSAQLVHVSALLPAALMGGVGTGPGQAGPGLPDELDPEACKAALERLQQERSRLEASLAQLSGPACPPLGLDDEAAQQAQLLGDLQREQERLQAALQAQLAQLGAPTRGGAAVRPLHHCFSFADPTGCAHLATALDVVAGKHLGTYVADSLQVASEALGALGPGQRVWAADCLAPADNRARFCRTAAAFQPGDVTVPTDLLRFDDRHQGAMLRAFGGFVIARDSQVAAALIEQHGVPSVTLDGSGGWRSEQRGPSRMEAKLRCDALRQSLAAAEEGIAAAEARLQQLQEAVEAHERRLAARSQAEARLREFEEEEARCQAELQVHALAATAGMSAGELQTKLRQLQQEMKEHLREVEALEGEAQRWDSDQLAEELADKQAQLAAAERGLQEEQEAVKQQQQRLEALVEQRAAAAAQLEAQRREQAALQAQLRAVEKRQGEVSRAQAQLQALEPPASAIAGDSPAVPPAEASAGEPLLEPGELAQVAAECACQWKALAKLQAEKAELAAGVAGGSLLHEQARARQAAHTAHRRQLELLGKAVAALEEGIAGSNDTVVETNNVVAAAVRSLFATLCAEVLPKLAFRLQPQGGNAHEGLLLEYAQRERAEGGDGEGWSASLDALSGGQRTLVSLAFVLAAQLAGAGCGVLLMDEVDAALDEANQHLVGRLINHLLSDANSSCRQVLCVSHNSALQELCSSIVSLGPAGGGAAAAVPKRQRR